MNYVMYPSIAFLQNIWKLKIINYTKNSAFYSILDEKDYLLLKSKALESSIRRKLDQR